MSVTRQMRRHQERMARKGKVPLTRGSAYAPGPTTERLVECALIDRDGALHHGFKSHYDLRASLGRSHPHQQDVDDTYGFWTSAKRFVDRREGNPIAAVSGQCVLLQREMLSADVDW